MWKNMLCRYVMDFHFPVIEKSWKVIIEKEWAPCFLLYSAAEAVWANIN